MGLLNGYNGNKSNAAKSTGARPPQTKKQYTERTKMPKCNAADTDRAQRLRDAINTATNMNAPLAKHWPQDIRRLREQDLEGDAARLDRVLDWYLKNMGKPFIPSVFNAAMFRDKFGQIEDAYKRYPPDVPVGKNAARMAENFRAQLIWPKGCGPQLEQSIQRSINTYLAWQKKLEAYLARRQAETPNAPMVGFLEKLVVVSGGATDAAQRHFERLNERLHNWDTWDGDLRPLELKLDERFDAWGRGEAESYGLPSSAWDILQRGIAEIEATQGAA